MSAPTDITTIDIVNRVTICKEIDPSSHCASAASRLGGLAATGVVREGICGRVRRARSPINRLRLSAARMHAA